MLTALELAGFKSFADKARLEIPAGVTCVVGPNGSGKSNVVDAIKWVMGTQSPKSLRGSEMTDVIFNGSAARRPLNAAEVTLEFDNRSGLFELKEDTVRITRRVYRSGEGEYAINGTQCRLKDIRELLAGTGAGTESYSIIEQGRVDAVLRASPKDRRSLFEEAAGISRFRLKKQEAARRLARVEQNLLRLSDIVDEVEGRLRRVRSQAGKAQRYREQAERLKQLRTELGLADWWTATSRLKELDQTIAQTKSQCGELRVEIQAAEQRLHQAGSEAEAEALSAVQRALAAAREQIAACDAAATAESQRHDELAEELRHAQRRLVGVRSEPVEGASTQQTLRQNLQETRDRAAEQRSVERKIADDLAKQDQSLSALRKSLSEVTERSKQLKQQLQKRQREGDRLTALDEVGQSQLADHQKMLDRLGGQAEEARQELQAAQRQLGQLDRDARTAESAFSEATASAAELRDSLAAHQKTLGEVRASRVRDEHKLAALDDAVTRLETLRNEIGRLLESEQPGGRPPAKVCGLVADLIHVDFDNAPMIEAALGERAHHLVIDDGDGLLAAFAAQPGVLTTRAVFERLDVKSAGAAVDRIDLAGEQGVMGRADQFVGAEPNCELMVSRLLGRFWIVDNLATARRLASGKGRGLSFVTFKGECLHADGAIALGGTSADGGVLTQHQRAGLLREAIQAQDRRIAELRQAITRTEQQLEDAEQQSTQLESSRQGLVTQLSDAQQLVATLTERSRQLEQEQQRLSATVAHEAKACQEGQYEIRAIHEELSEAQAERQQIAAQQESLQQEIEGKELEVTRLKSAATAAHVELVKYEQHAAILSEQIAQHRKSRDQRTSAETDAADVVATLHARLRSSRLALLNKRSELASLWLVHEKQAAEAASLAKRRSREEQDRNRLSRLVTAARQRLEGEQRREQQASLVAERIRTEQANLVRRLQEDYQIDLPEAARAAGPPQAALTDRTALEREVASLKGEVGSIGSVNLDSLDELDELESRFDQLSSQYQDLAEAKTSLERLSSRISNESRDLFLATVEEVRGHFSELFRRLFGGGEADIVLLEEEGGDPLDAGVDIAASPPGKELRSLSLMSGGEKTMTCVALLLAVFRTKPSPFCVLDEVDAALDEANIGRFTGVLSEFLSSTQFIVVTHSKKTMTGADTLYGVTMQESGVSKQVAVRFEDVGEDGQIDPAATLRRSPRVLPRAA